MLPETGEFSSKLGGGDGREEDARKNRSAEVCVKGSCDGGGGRGGGRRGRRFDPLETESGTTSGAFDGEDRECSDVELPYLKHTRTQLVIEQRQFEVEAGV